MTILFNSFASHCNLRSTDTLCFRDIFRFPDKSEFNLPYASMLMMTVLLWSMLMPTVAAAADKNKADSALHMKRYVVKSSFADIREDIELAITEQGLVINNVSHIGTMLERTGKVAGSKKHIFLKAEALEFCSAKLSRRMMEADPHNIVFCPYILFIYVLPEQPERVYLAYRRMAPVGSTASRNSLIAVEALLDEIIHAVLD